MINNHLDTGKITFLIRSLGGGGAQKVCVTLANSFHQRGKGVEIVVLHLVNPVAAEALHQDIQVVNLNSGKTRHSFVKLARYCRHNKPESILVFNNQLVIFLVIIRSILNLRFRLIGRSINTMSHLKRIQGSFWHRYIVDGLTRMFYRRADILVAQSRGMAEDLLDNYGVKQNKLRIIYNPLDTAFETTMKSQTIHFDGGRGSYILCVGRLEQQKAFQLAIRAFHQISPDYPEIRLIILGEGSMRPALKKIIEDLDLSDKVELPGFKIDTPPIYYDARLTLLTSLFEGFPNVLVESISMGTPVVAHDCMSGPRELIADGINGFLAAYNDPKDLIKKIVLALDHDWNRQRIVQTSQRFRSETITDQYLDLFT